MLGNIASRLGWVLLPIAGRGHKNSAAWKKDLKKWVFAWKGLIFVLFSGHCVEEVFVYLGDISSNKPLNILGFQIPIAWDKVGNALGSQTCLPKYWTNQPGKSWHNCCWQYFFLQVKLVAIFKNLHWYLTGWCVRQRSCLWTEIPPFYKILPKGKFKKKCSSLESVDVWILLKNKYWVYSNSSWFSLLSLQIVVCSNSNPEKPPLDH